MLMQVAATRLSIAAAAMSESANTWLWMSTVVVIH